MTQGGKKKHHYVPISYLKGFADNKGKIWVYSKDRPLDPLTMIPSNVGFRNYYYAQPMPDGGRELNALEDRFSELESLWPCLVEDIRAERVDERGLETLFQFIALQHARVPATRDIVELILAAHVKATVKTLLHSGQLPPPPSEIANFPDKLIVSIDPHKSIYAMVDIIKSVGELLDALGLGVIHNQTAIPFITSDNPVIWFDPRFPESELRPHTFESGGPILFFFPVTADLAIIGTKESRPEFKKCGLLCRYTTNEEYIVWINRTTAKFAYEAFFASKGSFSSLAQEFSGVSPTVAFSEGEQDGGRSVSYTRVFGPRKKKAKWNGTER